MTENNPQKTRKMDFWHYALCCYTINMKVFYGDDFPKKKQEMLGSKVLSQDLHD